MRNHNVKFPLPFYTSTSEGFGNRVCFAVGVTIHKCKSQGEAIELCDRLNKAFNDVVYAPRVNIASGEDFPIDHKEAYHQT